MNVSGTKTRNLILDTAVTLFMEKGFSAVTMSDFCQECNLSRGGLYRHFSSTSEIFEAMLIRDKDDYQNIMETAIANGTSAVMMLKDYLKQSIKEMLNGSGRLSLAAYEYVRSAPDGKDFSRARYNAAVKMMATLLQYGIDRQEFKPVNVKVVSEHAVIFIDGLRLAAVFSVDETTITEQFDDFLRSVVKEEYI